MSVFSNVKLSPPIEVFSLMQAYKDDTFHNKVDLSAGVYKTEENKSWVLPVVKQVEKIFVDDETITKDYLPVLGNEQFSIAATKLLLGPDSPAIVEKRAFGIQSLSGTGSIRVAADFLAEHIGYRVFYASTPTWENHNLVFKKAGFTEGRRYRYWSAANRGLDIDGFLEDLRNAPENSVIILHAVAHNPTGCDPTQEQWKQIADIMEERKLFPFFDCAYQGFASGDLDRDAWAVRYFASRGFELICCQSFAKSFGMYNERIGNITFVIKDAALVPNIKSEVTWIVRGNYSNPPANGARIITRILNDPLLFQQWKDCIKTMSSRIIEMRKALRSALEELGTPGNWEHITTQIGMFSYTGLNENQSLHMIKKYHIYMLNTGRISMCGLNHKNLDYVARAIHDTVTTVQ